MNLEIFIEFFQNLILLLAVSMLYIVFPIRQLKFSYIKKIIIGCIIGLVGVGIMSIPFELAPGIIFDLRAVLISITGMFFGFIPTILTAIITILFRIYNGGIGVLSGVTEIIISMILGLLWHHFRFKKVVSSNNKLRNLELFLFGFIIGIVSICSTAVLSWTIALKISISIIIIYPIATVLFGLIILRGIDYTNTNFRLKESEGRLDATLHSVSDGVITTDIEGNVTLINKSAEKILKHNSHDVIGKSINEFSDLLDKHERSLSPIKDKDGNVIGLVISIRDTSESNKQKERINYLLYHDELTGIYNRVFFDEELKVLDNEENLPLTILIGDVNGLKLVNDAFGHSMGDILLKKMSHEIKKSCRKDDIIARWGGDEFIILLAKTNEKEAEKICNNIISNCSKVKLADIDFSISLGYEIKHNFYENIMEVIKTAEDNMYKIKSIDSPSMRWNTINTILLTFHEKNEREQLHSNRVSELCKNIAAAMGLSENEINDLGIIGLMHDIGKIAIDDNILNKKDPLTDSEWKELKKHPSTGYRILSASNNMSFIAKYVLAHHERLDGTGYPYGLKENKIPLQSRILAIADSYDAMTSKRTYKNVLTKDLAVKELLRNSGTQFDADIVKVFIEDVLKTEIA